MVLDLKARMFGAKRNATSPRGLIATSALILSLVDVSVSEHVNTAHANPTVRSGFDCLIMARQTIDLASPVAGRLAEVMVDRGDRVKAGQPVARLEADVEGAQRAIAAARASSNAQINLRRTRLANQQRKLARSSGIIRSGVMTPQEADDLRTARDVARLEVREAEDLAKLAKLELERAELEVRRRTVKSPINGVVIDRKVDVGEAVGRDPLLTIAQLDPLSIEVFVPVATISKVKLGADMNVQPEAGGGEAFKATVEVIDAVADAASGTVKIRLTAENPDSARRAGLKCKASL